MAGRLLTTPSPKSAEIANEEPQIIRTIKIGKFTEIHEAVKFDSGKSLVVKVPRSKNRNSYIEMEYYILRKLGKVDKYEHFPKPFSISLYKNTGRYALTMDKLGLSLEALFNRFNRDFSICCICNIALQALECIEILHNRGYVSRCVMPDNFLIEDRRNLSLATSFKMIDFQFAQKWHTIDEEASDESNGITVMKHIECQGGIPLIGSPRYCSINAHKGIELSRRDDLESLGYILIYFANNGRLPWQGLKGPFKNCHEQWKKIFLIKEETKLDVLCHGLPDEFQEYISMCRKLKFDETPDYNAMRLLFKNVVNENSGVLHQFDWNVSQPVWQPVSLPTRASAPDS